MYIAYDRDEAGDKAAAKLAEELMEMGIECFRVQFPKGQDANEYASYDAARSEGAGRVADRRGVAGQRQAGRACSVVQASCERSATDRGAKSKSRS